MLRAFRGLLLGVACLWTNSSWANEPISFVRQVAPILADQCLGCHNERKTEGAYSLATFELLRKGGDRGPALVEGKPEESVLSQMMHGTEEPLMPFESDPLPPEQIAVIDGWIREGAKFDGADASLALRDLVDGSKTPPDLYPAPVPIAALAFNPEGTRVATSGYHEVMFWEIPSGKLARRLPVPSQRVQSLAWSPDGEMVLYAGGTPARLGEVALIKEEDPSFRKVLFQGKDVVMAAQFRPSGSHVAAGGTDRVLRVWETDSGKEIAAIENHADWILGIAYSPDGTKLLSASRDRSVKVWDQEKREPVVTFSKHTDGVQSVAVSPDNGLACSVGNDKLLRFWKIDSTAEQVREVGGHAEAILRIDWLRKKNVVVSASVDRRVIAWNPADGAVIREFAGSADVVHSVAVSADETKLAAGTFHGHVRLWNFDNAELIADFEAYPRAPQVSIAPVHAP